MEEKVCVQGTSRFPPNFATNTRTIQKIARRNTSRELDGNKSLAKYIQYTSTHLGHNGDVTVAVTLLFPGMFASMRLLYYSPGIKKYVEEVVPRSENCY